MPTLEEMRQALADWSETCAEWPAPLPMSARRLAGLLGRVADAQDAAEGRSATRAADTGAEEYSSTGLPRRATARARRHGARVTSNNEWHTVIFPNGSQVVALTALRARRTREGGLKAFPGMVGAVKPGAAPGCNPPGQRGDRLVDVLNRFSDAEEARA
jgi:hypothetical protein